MKVTFTINEKNFTANPFSVPVDTSLNTFIRLHAKLPGTKFMCLEGGCGACIVSVCGHHPVTKKKSTWAVNSCLVNIYSCHGLDITTIEGIVSKKNGYHDIQKRLTKFNGTQCGYCSPGMIMNMYSLLKSKGDQVSMKEIENSFGGNICRCTGYRPILDAFKSMAHDADEKLLEVCRDIEDLVKICPKTGSPCAGKCHVAETATTEPLHMFFAEDKEWHKVNTVKDIFTIFESLGSKPYMLVAGNTAHGVYRRSPDLQAFIDISGVDELRTHAVAETIDLGGGVTLTETMNILTKASADPKFAYALEIVKHIDLVANVPVRNIGSLAGNLSIKNQHKEFPSDIFITFEAAGATITLDEGGGTIKTVSPAQFVKEDMSKKVFMKISLPALDSKKFVYRSYKIMPRAQNAHAYVNAAFLLEFDDAKENVLSARLCFGGIKPDFIHAELTEKFLVGKDLYNNDVLEEALAVMTQELDPDWVLPDASPDYRKNLALSLFYKFVLNTCPEAKLRPAYKSGGTITDRVLSSGQQTFDTNERNWPVNKNVPKIEGLIQCSGEAEYTNDIAPHPHELWAAFVVGTEVHARITDIDTNEVMAIPGVVAFYSAKDIPGKNNFMPDKVPFNTEIEEVFCSGEVLFHGQPIGVILADGFDVANYAAKKVVVKYDKNSEIPIVTTAKQAIEENHKNRFHLISQNTKKQTENAQHVINGRFEIGSQYHYTMEPQTCICFPCDDGMDVYSATQWIDTTQTAISEVLGVPENRLNFRVKRLGGGYGAKLTRSTQVSCACALAAYLMNRPVRFVLTLESTMNSLGKRYSCLNDYEVNFDEAGKIFNLHNDYVQDYGCSLNEMVEPITTSAFQNCYVKNGWNIKATAVKTNAPSHTWCRAPGSTEGIAMIENIMEHIAYTIEKEPLEVRLANISNDSKMKKILLDFAKNVDYYERKAQINKLNEQNRWRKRGIAIVPMKYFIQHYGTLHANVSIYYADGSIAISHGGIEMGQGINTKAAQVAAHILGVPLDIIVVKATNSFTSANDINTACSMTSDLVGYAVKKACEQLLDRMKPVREQLKNAKWAEITQSCYNKSIDLCSSYMFKMDDVKNYDVWGVSCVEVELDLLTGNLQVARADILEDTGESLSPGIDVGQIEGAFVMGLGYWLHENLIYNKENGKLLTNRTWTYKTPGAKDIPIDFRITLLQKSDNPCGILRSKGTGEPALCMSVVVIFALRHALNSARKDAGLGDSWFNMGAPSMPEHLFLASGNSIQQYKLK